MIKKLKIDKKKIIKKKIAISKKKKDFLGKIFLPYAFDNIENIIQSFLILEKKKIC